MDALGIADGAVVADFGAGGGWFTTRLARRVGPNGIVYAQDIQPLMIEAITSRVQNEGLTNVRTIMGTPNDPRLPGGLDAILVVDAYHEMNDPARPEFIVTLLRSASPRRSSRSAASASSTTCRAVAARTGRERARQSRRRRASRGRGGSAAAVAPGHSAVPVPAGVRQSGTGCGHPRTP